MVFRPVRTAVTALVALTVFAASTGTAVATPVYRFYGIGDSVMIDASSSLRHSLPGIAINAAVSRQVSDGVAILQKKYNEHTIAGTTVFGLGTNGSLSADQLWKIMHLTHGHRLVMITSHCPYCSWTASNNRTIRALCTAAHHCWIAEFAVHAQYHPEWFTSDGVHMQPDSAGTKAYAHYVWLACRAAHSWSY